MLHEVMLLNGRSKVIRETLPEPAQEHAAEQRARRLELRQLQEWRKPVGAKLVDAGRMLQAED